MDFSILIATMHSRKPLFDKLLIEVNRQICEINEIRLRVINTNKGRFMKSRRIPTFEVLYEVDGGEMTLGAKRNLLVSRANGKYCCFIDDDDIISPTFLQTFVPMIYGDYDCASFLGIYYYRGTSNTPYEKLFYHSLDVKDWAEVDSKYLRSVSPMNMIKTDIVRNVRYADIRNTEDHEFSIRLMKSGLLHREFKIPNVPIYHYIDGVKGTRELWNYKWIENFTKIELFIS